VLPITILFVTAVLTGSQAPAMSSTAGNMAPVAERRAATVLPSESSLIGIIDAFEQAAQRLVLQTKTERVTFVLASDVVIRLGSKTLSAAELAAHRGRRAKIRFTLVNGRRTAHWIVISAERN
jgi:hypothetical protein